MPASLLGIDHVLIGVQDIERARMAWTRLGFTLTPRGRHLNRGTGNYCVMFPDDYIELLGVVDPSTPNDELKAFLTRGEGPRGLAFAATSSEAAAAALAQRGLHPGTPRELARQLELPTGTLLPRFRLVDLPAEETPALSSFICEHRTPELVRRPEWLAHANAASGVVSVAVMVPETASLRAPYERLFGADVNMTDDVLTVHIGPHRIIFATPDDIATLYPEAELDPTLPLPAMVAMVLASRDLDATADHLARWQVAHEEIGGGALLIPAAEASGTLLLFTSGGESVSRPFPRRI